MSLRPGGCPVGWEINLYISEVNYANIPREPLLLPWWGLLGSLLAGELISQQQARFLHTATWRPVNIQSLKMQHELHRPVPEAFNFTTSLVHLRNTFHSARMDLKTINIVTCKNTLCKQDSYPMPQDQGEGCNICNWFYKGGGVKNSSSKSRVLSRYDVAGAPHQAYR